MKLNYKFIKKGNFVNNKSCGIDPVYKRFKVDPGVGITKG